MRLSYGLILPALFAATALSAETVTLPAAASVVGGSPFYSDVRTFNSSYTATLEVMAEYRCFMGHASPRAERGPSRSELSELGLPATDDISPGHDFVVTSFTPQAWQRGNYPFVCTQSGCGGDPEQHAGMVGLLVVEWPRRR